MPADHPALVATDVSVVLGGADILRRVSVTIDFGQLTVIAGPNGAGKSTLLRSMLGLIDTSEGGIRCEGIPIGELSRLERARRIAYVPQRSVLDAALSVAQVVAMGRYATRESTAKRQRAVNDVLHRVGLDDIAERDYLSLSGGEQRLTLIARALSTGARIICLDEPTASLDIKNRLRTLELLRQLARDGHAIACVLHELQDVRRFADHAVLMHEGRAVASGSAADVIVPERIRTVYGVELRENDAIGFHLGGSA